jgi:neutral ceramidase
MPTYIPFQAGWATREITPDIPCRMGGYIARTAPANAMHDPLCACALALGSREQPLVLVICDLVGVDEALVDEVRAQVVTQYPGASVWLGATHTHSGPDVARSLSFAREAPDPTLRQRIIAGASSAAEAALANLHPVWVKWASGRVDNIAGNRDHPETSADLTLDMLCFYETDDPQAQPSALFASFPCHPTILGAENLALSADLPGAFRRQLRTQLGDEVWVALATGAAGDISTRHTRQGQGFAELERLGALLAQQAHALLTDARPLTLTQPRTRAIHIGFARKEPLAPDVLAASVLSVQARMNAERQAGNPAQARTLETVLQGLETAQRGTTLAPDEQLPTLTVSVSFVGELALIAVPAELYHRSGLQIKRAGKYTVLLLGYTNGYAGYLPARAAYAAMDYEALVSPFAPGSAERLETMLEQLLKQEEP